MRIRILVVTALLALAVPSATIARSAKSHDRGGGQGSQILGTWSVQVMPNGQPPNAALVTFTRGGGLIETESDAPGTAQGSWKQVGPRRFALAFETFIFTSTGAPGGHVVVRALVTLSHGTLSGPFKFDVFDTAGHVVESGSGTATATRFVIPPF